MDQGLPDRDAGFDATCFHFVALGDHACALVAEHADRFSDQEAVADPLGRNIKAVGIKMSYWLMCTHASYPSDAGDVCSRWRKKKTKENRPGRSVTISFLSSADSPSRWRQHDVAIPVIRRRGRRADLGALALVAFRSNGENAIRTERPTCAAAWRAVVAQARRLACSR